MDAMSIGRPDLAAIDHPAPVAFHGAGAHRREIGAAVRLAHADAEGTLTLADARKDQVFRSFAAVSQNLRAGLPIRDPMREAGSSGGEHLLRDDIAHEAGKGLTAILLGPGDTYESSSANTAAELRVEGAPGAPMRCIAAGFSLRGEKLAHTAPGRQGFRWETGR